MRPLSIALLISSLAAGPAVAGVCLQDKEGLRCSDGGETIILQGPSGTYGKLAGEKLVMQRDGQGNTFGAIGGEKLLIMRTQGMSVAKLGQRKLLCAEVSGGVTICK